MKSNSFLHRFTAGVQEAVMPKQYFFSINLLIRNDEHIEQAISSLTADETFFPEHVQLILVDSVCSDKSIAVCTKYSEDFPDNIFFVDTSGKKSGACYNDSVPLCTGQYIACTDNFGLYSEHALPILYRYLSEDPVPVAAIRPMILSDSGQTVPYIDSFPSGHVSLKEAPDRFILMLGCYFFDRQTAFSLSFDTSLKIHCHDKFITEALLKTYSFLFIDECSYTTSLPTERNFLRFAPQYSKAFYINSINDFIIPMLRDYAGSLLVQSVMLYLINIKFAMNQNQRYKYAVTEGYIKDFFHCVHDALQLIDNYIILNKRLCMLCGLDPEFPFSLIRMKYKNQTLMPDIDLVLFKDTVEKGYFESNGLMITHTLNGQFAASIRQSFISDSTEIAVKIIAVNCVDGVLHIDAFLENCSYLRDSFSLYTLVNQKRMEIIPSEIDTVQTVFDMPFVRKFAFRFSVPVSPGKQIDNACIMMKYQNLSFRLDMHFDSLFARLSADIPFSFWCFADKVLTYDRKTKCLVIRQATENLLAFYENKFLVQASKLLPFSESIYYRQLRKNVRKLKKDKNDCKYFIFYDDFGINSNGNLLFRFFSKARNRRKFIPFFVTPKDSSEYAFLSHAGYDNILAAGSRKAKTVILAADVIFASGSNVYDSLGFTHSDKLFLKDLFEPEIFSVKNFFMNYETASSDNRLTDNIRRCFCASQTEREHLLQKEYDFDSSMIHVTGYPVFDSALNEKENLILIAPGTRKQFCTYNYSDYYRFAESAFFKTYNAIITDSRLLDALKTHNFKLAVLMPPAIEKYMNAFLSNDIVGLYSYTEKNLTLLVSKAAVLVTDYSELLYKIAYLDKPVICYFPKNLPLQSEYKNAADPRHSLGEIITEHDTLIQYLTDNMPNGFPLPEKYRKRAESFFAYRDNKNCRRIFETIMQHTMPDTPSES